MAFDNRNQQHNQNPAKMQNNPQNMPKPNADDPKHREINPEPRRDEPQQPYRNEPGTPGKSNPDAPEKTDDNRGALLGSPREPMFGKEDKPVKKIPVKLLRGYFPKDPDHPKNPATGDSEKVERGTIMRLPVEEARELLGQRIAERADDLPA